MIGFSLSRLSRAGLFFGVLAILSLTLAASVFAQTPSARTLKNWRDGMAHVPPPQPGCFTSTYPNTQWQQVPCKPAPQHPFILSHGPRTSTVGGGNDVAVGVSSGTISLAVGSFDSVTGVTSVTSMFGSNDYSLQLNTNLFTTSACSVAANPSQCSGWVQFLYSQDQCSGPCVFFEYSLINVGSSSNCPAGWGSYNIGEEVCYFNTNGVGPSTAPPISDLGNLSLIAEAQSGGNDTVIFSSGSALYMVQNPDSQEDLASGWNSFEYNLVGDSSGSAATFNSGAAITVRASVENGSPSAPSCVSDTFTGYTGETNNLNFANAPAAIQGTAPAIMFAESTSGTVSEPCSSATAVASGALVDTHDFNADGMSDILWGNTSAGFAMWLMNGSAVQSSVGVGTASGWSVAGQRDFNGDGKADILFHNTSGNVAMWFMNGAQVIGSAGVGNASPSVWSIAGTGDFNGQGYGDILWHDASGDVAIWLMNGSSIVQSCGVGNANPSVWSIAGTGDFNGDGKTDILWHDSSGNVAIWFMNGCSVIQSSGVGNANPSVWSIAGTGDFNGDGKADILWHDTSGDVAMWMMNGAAISQSAGVGNANPSVWSIADTGDLNGDGMSDILWHDTSGNVAVWEMNGAAISHSAGIGNASASVWTIQGLNAD
jgi:hypothetical protein